MCRIKLKYSIRGKEIENQLVRKERPCDIYFFDPHELDNGKKQELMNLINH